MIYNLFCPIDFIEYIDIIYLKGGIYYEKCTK
nr:MAG TPA: hypothetical protein [Caudoviricetes sp.]